MAAAVWMIMYDLDRRHADEYLQWFDEVHIPEKLARPGYRWAAHYRVVADEQASDSRYIALFGGTDSGVFYNPSPAQIKPNQSPLTRGMMRHRANSKMLILAEEWVVGGQVEAADTSASISAERIGLVLFDANENDESLGAWLVQDYRVNSGKPGNTRKYLASSGKPRHLVVQELSGDEMSRDRIADGAWWHTAEQLPGYLSYPLGGPITARRVWPEIR